jgi:hypothetical protein
MHFRHEQNRCNITITSLPVNVLDHAADAADNACSIACDTLCDTDFYGYQSGTTVKVVELLVQLQLTTSLSISAVLAKLKNKIQLLVLKATDS